MITRFDVLRNQCEDPLDIPSFADFYSEALIGALNATKFVECEFDGNGLSNSTLTSTKTIGKLKNALSSDGYTISMWLRPQGTISFERPIFSIEALIPPSTVDLYSCAYNLRVVVQKSTNYLKVQLCEALISGGSSSASHWEQATSVSFGEPSVIHHLSLSLSTAATGMSICIYVDGALSATLQPPQIYRPSKWTETYHLKLFPVPTPAMMSVHSLSVIAGPLSHDEIKELYNQHLPNSAPVITSIALLVQQNGEEGDHSLQPDFYLLKTIPPALLAPLRLPIVDQDESPRSPNFASTACPPEVSITALPSVGRGEFFSMSGAAIDAVPYLLPYTAQSNSSLAAGFFIKYRPPLDVVSQGGLPIVDFALEVVDCLGATTGSIRMGIVVTRVDKPPVANSLQLKARAGMRNSLILEGSDHDGVSTIERAIVTTGPVQGNLYPLYRNGTLGHLLVLSAGSTKYPYATYAGMPAGIFSLVYVYTGPLTLLSAATNDSSSSPQREGVLYIDHLQYSLVDNEGRASLPAAVNITVYSPLIATASERSVVQGVGISIPITGSRMRSDSGTGAADTTQVRVQVVDLPSHGSLSWSNTGTPVKPSETSSCAMTVPVIGLDRMMASERTRGKPSPWPTFGPRTPSARPSIYPSSPPTTLPSACTFIYTSTPNFFSNPNTTAQYLTLPKLSPNSGSISIPSAVPDSFTFRLVGVEDIDIYSSVVTQVVNVVNKNKPTSITYLYPSPPSSPRAPPLHWSVYPISYVKSGSDVGTTATLSGFTIMDPDKGTDRLRVTITTTRKAVLSLPAELIQHLDFTSMAACRSSVWRCQGTGFADPYLSFVGRPDVIENALNGMRYQSAYPNYMDNITVTLFDGVGGECLPAAAVGPSVHAGCFKASASVLVRVLDYAELPSTFTVAVSNGLLDIKYIGLAAIVCCLCSLGVLGRQCVRRYGCCGKKEAAAVVEHDKKDLEGLLHDKGARRASEGSTRAASTPHTHPHPHTRTRTPNQAKKNARAVDNHHHLPVPVPQSEPVPELAKLYPPAPAVGTELDLSWRAMECASPSSPSSHHSRPLHRTPMLGTWTPPMLRQLTPNTSPGLDQAYGAPFFAHTTNSHTRRAVPERH